MTPDGGSLAPAVRLQLGVRIPLRDGIRLSGNLYLPRNCSQPAPAITMLTPYVAQTYHDRGLYFAAQGYPFLAVDVRGRGNSEGVFRPLIQETEDGVDVVEWLSAQTFCNGQVGMWGGSYSGYAQWAVAKSRPSHLRTIVPVSAPYPGVDFPGHRGIPRPYLLQWLAFVWGRTSQDKLFWKNEGYWGELFRDAFESHVPFRSLDTFCGFSSPVFQEWCSQPNRDDYWESYNPSSKQYADIDLPILTITGVYDGDQAGALMHYAEHIRNADALSRAKHFLIIGPWDHAGTRTPEMRFCGLEVGPASLLDLPKLHCDWYAWSMKRGPLPSFLKDNVSCYVTGADYWRHTETLEALTKRHQSYYLHSTSNPIDVFGSGVLSPNLPQTAMSASYVYEPRDTSIAALEATIDPECRTDQRLLFASVGKYLNYHSPPFENDVEITGFFRLTLWLSINQPDTDVRAVVSAVLLDGSSVELTRDSLRARYRLSARNPSLIDTQDPLRYEFDHFAFVSRLMCRGDRLRLTIGPNHSIYSQRNYNTGGIVADESIENARIVGVSLWCDAKRPSSLRVPIGRRPEDV